jgi:hypothetical protein
MSIDHDQIFKTLIEAFFAEFMFLFCPAEAALIDFSRVEFLRKEYFTDTQQGKRREMDLVVKVLLKNGSEKYILIHIEFESKRPNRDFAQRMYRYYCQLFLRYDSEIVPIVVFSDDARWKKQVTNSFEVRVAGTTFVRFQYHMIKLRALNYRSFLGSENPLAYALMAKMDYDRTEQARMKADFLRWILGSPVDPARKSLLVEFIETYVPLSGELLFEFEHLIHSEEQYAEVEQMVTIYEKRGIEQGIERGIERGIEQGIERGKRNLLLQLLQKKFGDLPKDLESAIGRVEAAEQLDQLSLAVLDVPSLDEFLKLLPNSLK